MNWVGSIWIAKITVSPFVGSTGVPAADQRYPDARFYMGLSAYGAADFASAADYFREVVKLMPLNEVYNNLGAAEDQLNQSAALDDFAGRSMAIPTTRLSIQPGCGAAEEQFF